MMDRWYRPPRPHLCFPMGRVSGGRYQTRAPEGVRRWNAAASAVVPVVVVVGARLRLPGIGRPWPSGIDLVEPVDHVDARAACGVEDRAFAAGVDGGPDGGEDLGCGNGTVVVEVGGHAGLCEGSAGVAGGVRLGFEGACADRLADRERVAVDVDLEAGVAVGLEGGSGLRSESGAGGAAGTADQVV